MVLQFHQIQRLLGAKGKIQGAQEAEHNIRKNKTS